MRYKVNVTFKGVASLEIDAPTAEAARLTAMELEIADLARPGHVDIFNFEVAAREITSAPSLYGESDPSAEDEDTSNKPRPSGWYRPL